MDSMKCKSCGHIMQDSDVYCEKCGQPVEKGDSDHNIACSHCGTVNASEDVFCMKCGSRLAEEQDDTPPIEEHTTGGEKDELPVETRATTNGEDDKLLIETKAANSEAGIDQTKPAASKGVNNKLAFVLAALLIIAIGTCIYLITSSDSDGSNQSSVPTPTSSTNIEPTITPAETPSASPSNDGGEATLADFTDYIGTWVSQTNSYTDEVYEYGGYVMDVIEALPDGIVFDLNHVSPRGRIGTIDGVVCTISDGVGSFKYASDSWGNSGKGVVRLEEGRIILTIETTESGEMANWDMGSGAIFVMADKEEPDTGVDANYDPTQEYMEEYYYDMEQMVLQGAERYYTRDELIPLDEYQLAILRNGMYALSGKQFTTNMDAIDFFSSRDWYQPVSTDDGVIIPQMNAYQKANADLIVSIEREVGFR